jgi:hypothetical protein
VTCGSLSLLTFILFFLLSRVVAQIIFSSAFDNYLQTFGAAL